MKPILDRIIVRRPKEVEVKTKSGLIIPEPALRKHRTVTVVSVGDGFRNQDGTFSPLSVEAGQEIVVNWGAGVEIEVDGETLYIIRESDIVGIL